MDHLILVIKDYFYSLPGPIIYYVFNAKSLIQLVYEKFESDNVLSKCGFIFKS